MALIADHIIAVIIAMVLCVKGLTAAGADMPVLFSIGLPFARAANMVVGIDLTIGLAAFCTHCLVLAVSGTAGAPGDILLAASVTGMVVVTVGVAVLSFAVLACKVITAVSALAGLGAIVVRQFFAFGCAAILTGLGSGAGCSVPIVIGSFIQHRVTYGTGLCSSTGGCCAGSVVAGSGFTGDGFHLGGCLFISKVLTTGRAMPVCQNTSIGASGALCFHIGQGALMFGSRLLGIIVFSLYL